MVARATSVFADSQAAHRWSLVLGLWSLIFNLAFGLRMSLMTWAAGRRTVAA